MPNQKKRSCLSIILAAGKGVRMKSSLPKVLHRIAGLEMVNHVVNLAMETGTDLCAVVTGESRKPVEKQVRAFNERVSFFEQYKCMGTAHALLAAEEVLLQKFDDVLVLFGDTPLLQCKTLGRMRQHLADGADIVVLGFEASNPCGYGRMIEKNGQLIAIREQKEASISEQKISFCNSGVMAINGKKCMELLEAISGDNVSGEYYLTDIVQIACERGLNIVACKTDEKEALGVNTRVDLSRAESIWQKRKRNELMMAGVSMSAPETVFLSYDTVIGNDSVLEPCQFFGSGVIIGQGVRVRAFCHFEQCRVENNCDIGPYARLRPGVEVSSSAKIGNFVEAKNARIGKGSKVNHVSYIGDTEIGADSNIGAGVITCNYDGVNKNLTQIGEGSFIGSNSALVAPVSIGDDVYVGAGSVVTQNAPSGSLVLSRTRQTIREGYTGILKRRATTSMKKKKDMDDNHY